MGQVIEFAPPRTRRLERAAQAAPFHPALKWTAGADNSTGHRRCAGTPAAACGTPGEITLAPTGAVLCPACYPTSSTA